jgi:hypothetical protein
MTQKDVATNDATHYAENLATQLRKGFLAYCVLKVSLEDLAEYLKGL